MYPPIDIHDLNNIIKLIEDVTAKPEILDDPDFVYGDEIASKLKKLTHWSPPAARASLTEEQKNPVGRPRKDPVLPIDEVEKEVDEIRKEIAQLKTDAKGLETADRIQIIKTRAALVEKIIAMKERITNVKKQQKFISDVIAIMEDVMDQTQREKVLSLLQPYTEE